MNVYLKKLIAIAASVALVLSFAGCSDDDEAGAIDYNHIIENYVEDGFNHEALVVGESHKPKAAIWLQTNAPGCTTYTSDPKVVTVSDLGKVDAVGVGSAYVIITAENGRMHDIMRYDVVATVEEKQKINSGISDTNRVTVSNSTHNEVEESVTKTAEIAESDKEEISGEVDEEAVESKSPAAPSNGIDYNKMIESYVENPFNKFDLKVGDEHKPTASVWLQSGTPNGTVYTSNPNVVTISDLGKVDAVGPGSAYVVITAQGDRMFEVYLYNVS